MSIVQHCYELEVWLQAHSDQWECLSDHEYRNLVKQWRIYFESIISRDTYIAQGKKAMGLVDDVLPIDGYGFSVPGYKYLPAGVSTQRPTYAYAYTGLHQIHRELWNANDLILVDTEYTYCCIYTHEWEGFSAPKLYQRADIRMTE